MKKSMLFSIPVIALLGSLSLQAKNQVPITSMTKSCKPLINKNLKIPKVPIKAMKPRVHKRIAKALEMLADEKYSESVTAFKVMMGEYKDLNVKATLARYIGIAYAQQSDTANATRFFEKSLDYGKGVLQPKELQDLTQNVAAMHYSNDNTKQSLKYLERWLRNSNVDNDKVYILYSAILHQAKRSREAVCAAYFAAKTSKKPNKNALGIMLAVHFEFKKMDDSIKILKQLILDFPKVKRYWRNISSIYMQKDKISDALAVMELFYVQGMMETEGDYKLLSAIFAFSDIPYRTAVILKEGIEKGVVKDNDKNWENVASGFHSANELEKAIVAYGKSASKTDSGKFDLKQAELLSDLDEFKKAILAFNKALKKGSLKQPGKAYFGKGLAQIGLKQYNSAISSLTKATKYKKWNKRSKQWIAFVRNAKKNAELL